MQILFQIRLQNIEKYLSIAPVISLRLLLVSKNYFSKENIASFEKYVKFHSNNFNNKVIKDELAFPELFRKEERCFRLGSNQGPYASEAYVITTTLRKLYMYLQTSISLGQYIFLNKVYTILHLKYQISSGYENSVKFWH